MFFKKIFSEGLAHISYMVGDGDEIAVIDPRRDMQIYIDIAAEAGKRIKHIFETHRNEDIIYGSLELSELTGAEIHISKYEDLDYVYGNKIGEEDEFKIGELTIVPLHTPGHTLGHLSFLLKNKGNDYAVFTGDSLFYGDLGRTDFYGEDKLEEMTGMMYDSIYNKLFALDDGVLVYPAHGPGSACGGSIEEREVSTIGYEKKFNETVAADSREEFIEKNGYMRLKPPYFTLIEVANIKGAKRLGSSVVLNAVKMDEIDRSEWRNIIDLRDPDAHIGKRIPDSLALNPNVLSSYLGWFRDQSEKLYLLSDGVSREGVEKAYWTLARMGYDNIGGIIGNGSIHKLEMDDFKFQQIEAVSPSEYLELMKKDNAEDSVTIDVRKEGELHEGDNVFRSINLPLQKLPELLDRVPRDKKIYVTCNSGIRAVVASSLLKESGIDCTIIYGGVKGLNKLK